MIDALPPLANAASSAMLPMAKNNPSPETVTHVCVLIDGGKGSPQRMTPATGMKAARNQSVASSPEMWLVATFCNKAAAPQRKIGASTHPSVAGPNRLCLATLNR